MVLAHPTLPHPPPSNKSVTRLVPTPLCGLPPPAWAQLEQGRHGDRQSPGSMCGSAGGSKGATPRGRLHPGRCGRGGAAGGRRGCSIPVRPPRGPGPRTPPRLHIASPPTPGRARVTGPKAPAFPGARARSARSRSRLQSGRVPLSTPPGRGPR